MRTSTFFAYLLFFFFALFAVTSALPEPVTEDATALLARADDDGIDPSGGEDPTEVEDGRGGKYCRKGWDKCHKWGYCCQKKWDCCGNKYCCPPG
jgi:hypothetical protein